MQIIIYNRIANTFVDAVLITQSISRALSKQVVLFIGELFLCFSISSLCGIHLSSLHFVVSCQVLL
jgi:hypothetical protein